MHACTRYTHHRFELPVHRLKLTRAFHLPIDADHNRLQASLIGRVCFACPFHASTAGVRYAHPVHESRVRYSMRMRFISPFDTLGLRVSISSVTFTWASPAFAARVCSMSTLQACISYTYPRASWTCFARHTHIHHVRVRYTHPFYTCPTYLSAPSVN